MDQLAGRTAGSGSNRTEKLARALADVDEEYALDNPDKSNMSNALERALKIAAQADGFVEKADQIRERVTKIAGWLGPYAAPVLAAVGLSL